MAFKSGPFGAHLEGGTPSRLHSDLLGWGAGVCVLKPEERHSPNQQCLKFLFEMLKKHLLNASLLSAHIREFKYRGDRHINKSLGHL